jgi:Ca2+-binding RTX toxin-like protein
MGNMMLKYRATLLLTTMATALLMASGVALAQTISCSAQDACYGTEQADTMTGTNNSDLYIYGAGGADHIDGKGGSDHIDGGSGKDEIRGGDGRDYLAGGRGTASPDVSSDYVYGGKGKDLIWGGYADGGTDHIYGGEGDDAIKADEPSTEGSPTEEVIDCGAGEDEVWFDVGDVTDVVKNCEIKHAHITTGR